MNVAGKVCLITGGGRGIGAATARELHGRGARVAVLDIADCEAPPGGLALRADVTDREAIAAAVHEVVWHFGALDVVVANAGVTPVPATLRVMDPDDYDRVVAINQTGVFNTVHPAIEHVIAAGGHITVVASMAAMLPGPGGAPYMITKAAVEQLGRALRIELAAHGASAGVAYFGIVQTAMTEQMLDDDPLGAALAQQLPPPLRARISADDAACVIVDGIERRAARTVAPRAWTVVALLRGLANVLVDARAASDAALHDLIHELERRAPTRAGRSRAGTGAG